MGTRKIGPAVAAGCTMVIKPAKQTPLSMLALLRDPRGGRPARRACCNVITSSSSGSVMEPLIGDPRAAQAVLHRVDRGRAHAHRAVRRADPARLDGAGRQRAVPRLRRRRPRRRGRGRDDRQDAQHRRGLHGGQPLPRRRRRSPTSSPTGSAERMGALKVGRGTEDGRPGRPADRRHPAREGRRSSSRTRSAKGAKVARRRRAACDGPGYFYPPTVLTDVPRRRAPAQGGDLRPGRAGRDLRVRGGGDRAPPTTPSSASSPTSTRATSSARCA